MKQALESVGGGTLGQEFEKLQQKIAELQKKLENLGKGQ